MSDPIPADIAVRLLRAKAAELERRLLRAPVVDRVDYLGADLALLAGLLADLIERVEESSRVAPGELAYRGRLDELLGPGGGP